MPPRKKKTVESGPSYEDAFRELQEIVVQLESGTTSLEDSLALYERGQRLAKVCTELLEKAELRIRELAVPPDVDSDAVEEES